MARRRSEEDTMVILQLYGISLESDWEECSNNEDQGNLITITLYEFVNFIEIIVIIIKHEWNINKKYIENLRKFLSKKQCLSWNELEENKTCYCILVMV